MTEHICAWIANVGLVVALIGVVGRAAMGEPVYALLASVGFAVIGAALYGIEPR
jgi:hypothetical protein